MARPKKLSPEENLAQFFLKSVGAEVGFWNASTGEFVDGVEDEPLYQGNVSCFQNAMKAGYTFDDLHHMIGSNYKNGVRAALATAIIPERKNDDVEEHSNLLDPDEEYYHSALFNTSAPRFAVAGNMMIPVSRGSSTRKESYTLRDLLDYYRQVVPTVITNRNATTTMKTMVWLLSQATLDEILFAIDKAGDTGEEIPIVRLANFLPEAREELRYFRSRSE